MADIHRQVKKIKEVGSLWPTATYRVKNEGGFLLLLHSFMNIRKRFIFFIFSDRIRPLHF